MKRLLHTRLRPLYDLAGALVERRGFLWFASSDGGLFLRVGRRGEPLPTRLLELGAVERSVVADALFVVPRSGLRRVALGRSRLDAEVRVRELGALVVQDQFVRAVLAVHPRSVWKAPPTAFDGPVRAKRAGRVVAVVAGMAAPQEVTERGLGTALALQRERVQELLGGQA